MGMQVTSFVETADWWKGKGWNGLDLVSFAREDNRRSQFGTFLLLDGNGEKWKFEQID